MAPSDFRPNTFLLGKKRVFACNPFSPLSPSTGGKTRGGTIVIGERNLGGYLEPPPSAQRIAEPAVDKQAGTVLMPVAARRQLADLPDDIWTRLNIEFYKDAADAVFKALVE